MCKLLSLFWSLFKISFFVIGGGYAILIVADEVFSKQGITKEGELLEELPVFQMIPGLIATHTAVYVGRKVAGSLGAIVGVIAVAIPSIVIFSLVSVYYLKIPLHNPYLNSAFVGLRASLTGVIAATLIKNWTKSLFDTFSYSLMGLAFILIYFSIIPIAYVLILAMLIGISCEYLPKSGITCKSLAILPLLVFLKYGSLCFGGGFVIVPMYLADFVGPSAPYLQIAPEEFSNIMALTQMTPGPIGVNCATFFGFRLYGILGALIASCFLLLPGSIIAYFVVSSLERFRASRLVKGIMSGIRPASMAMMLVAFGAFARLSFWSNTGKFNYFALGFGIMCTIMILKKKLGVITLIILSAFAATIVRADEITIEKFPDADAVLVDGLDDIEYFADGTSVSVSDEWIKILTEKGRREESQVTIGYNARWGKSAIELVELISPEGVTNVVDVSKTISDTTDNSSMKENIYDPLDRQIVCSIPGMKIGDTLHLKVRRTITNARIQNQWADSNIFEWSVPFVKYAVRIKGPAERPLKSMRIRHPLGNVKESKTVNPDGSIVYLWTVKDSPQAFPEPDMPPLHTEVQSLRVSTAKDWAEISRWYWEVSLPHLAKTTPAITNEVTAILKNYNPTDFTGRLRAVYKWVSQNIRYMGLTMEDTSPGYAPHDVNITFENRYGVCRDKAALLVEMLRIAGFEAYPVLINAGAKQDPEVPMPFFNHAIVAVANPKAAGTKDKYILMDPTDESSRDLMPAYLSDCSYIVARPDGEDLRTSPIVPYTLNAVNIESMGTLAKDGTILLDVEITFTGINDNTYRRVLLRRTPEERRQLFARILQSRVPGAELLDFELLPIDLQDTEKLLAIRLKAQLPEMIFVGETCDQLDVPLLSQSIGVANWLFADKTSLDKRRFPLVVDSTAKVFETFRLRVNDALGEMVSLPPTVLIEGPLKYSSEYTFNNRILTVKRSLGANQVEFSPADYLTLCADLKRYEVSNRTKPMFAKDPLQDANVKYLKRETSYDFTSPYAWVSTNVVVKEVLTYNGKKSASEMQFGFNPACEYVTLVSASVSNRNGKVAFVSDKEMNVMDASWAAAAPRYPASKELIVNLPSVEVGSVISYVLVTTVTNSPAPFMGEWNFDVYEPTEELKVRLGDWERTVKTPKRLKREPMTAYGALWRDTKSLALGSWDEIRERLILATEVEAYEDIEALGIADLEIKTIRDWMAKHIRVVGPVLYEVPLNLQLTEPKTVLKERYATRLDYIRTLCALLKGAGYKADVIFAANDSDDDLSLIKYRKAYPAANEYSAALCRVQEKSGWFGPKGKTYYLGLENEYTPLSVTPYDGCSAIVPDKGFITIEGGEENFSHDKFELTVKENGTVEIAVENLLYGSAVGAFRKGYAEILPEDRRRHYLELLNGFSQAARPLSPLVTDITSYPARLAYTAEIPDYATVVSDTITLNVPGLMNRIFALTGTVRENPLGVSAASRAEMEVTITFPAGWTTIEHLPSEFTFMSPLGDGSVWCDFKVATMLNEHNCQVVKLTRTTHKRRAATLESSYFALLKDWGRLSGSRANRTIIIRKTK